MTDTAPTFTEAAAITALCLMDAVADYEMAAATNPARAKAGGCPVAALGRRLLDRRGEHGSYALRQEVLDLVPLVDDAWEDLEADAAFQKSMAPFSFDFDFCPLAIRLAYEHLDPQVAWQDAALRDDAFIVTLVAAALEAIESQSAADRERTISQAEAAVAQAEADVAQAEAALAATARTLAALRSS